MKSIKQYEFSVKILYHNYYLLYYQVSYENVYLIVHSILFLYFSKKAATLNDAASSTNTNEIRCLNSIAIIKSNFLNSVYQILSFIIHRIFTITQFIIYLLKTLSCAEFSISCWNQSTLSMLILPLIESAVVCLRLSSVNAK